MSNILKRLSKYKEIYRFLQNLYYWIIVKPECNIILFVHYLEIRLVESGILKEGERYKRIVELKSIHL